ncbi:MAG: response regulator [Planctomycetota bacterium]
MPHDQLNHAMLEIPRVLIVDDERHVTSLLRYKLESAGIAVHTANDGRAGFESALACIPDLVVVDFHMPYMNGIELARAMHGHPTTAETPVVVITAHAHCLRDEDLVDTNVCELLPKPFSPKDLLKTIHEILNTETV